MLVDKSTNKPVKNGDIIVDFKGRGCFFAGLSRGETMILAKLPRMEGSTVTPGLTGEYYPSVFPSYEIK